MRKLLALTAVGTVVLLGGQAVAADLPHYPNIDVPDVDYDVGGSFYLRGSAALNFHYAPDVTHPFDGTVYPIEEYGYGYSWGAGFGYETGTGLRFDATMDSVETAGLKITKTSPPANPAEVGDYTLMLRSTVALANVYYDLPTIAGFRPYVGAGIGASYLRTSNVQSLNPPAINPTGVVDSHGGAGNWNFAWALMAGTSYTISDHLALDIGYRYLNLGDAVSAPITAGGGTAPIEYNNIDAHEIRAGVRYTF